MDAFETIVRACLEEHGYWILQSVKVQLTPNEKESLGARSMPTPEIDLVAYKADGDELLLLEVKSFLDSGGVDFRGLSGAEPKTAKRYKLLNDRRFREIISNKLRVDFEKRGFITSSTLVRFGLAAGNVWHGDRVAVRDYMQRHGFAYFEPEFIRDTLVKRKRAVYLNDAVTMTIKMVKEFLPD